MTTILLCILGWFLIGACVGVLGRVYWDFDRSQVTISLLVWPISLLFALGEKLADLGDWLDGRRCK